MKTKTLVLGTTLALAVTTFAGVAIARPGGFGGFGGGFGMGGGFGRLLRSLDLTDAQEDMVHEMGQEMRKQHRALAEEGRTALDAAAAELAKPAPDKTKLHALLDQHLEGRKRIAHLGIDRILQIHGTLSPAQREELADHLRRFQERLDEDDFGPGRGHGPGMGPGRGRRFD